MNNTFESVAFLLALALSVGIGALYDYLYFSRRLKALTARFETLFTHYKMLENLSADHEYRLQEMEREKIEN